MCSMGVMNKKNYATQGAKKSLCVVSERHNRRDGSLIEMIIQNMAPSKN